MAIINPINVSEIEFDKQDLEVFRIHNVNERIDRLQKHFFPRLELLVKDSLKLVEEIYGIDPYAGMNSVYRPSNRKNSSTKTQHGPVYVGRSGKRRKANQEQPLAIKNALGKSIYIHTAYLTFDILPEGCIRTRFLPFRNSIESSFVDKVRQEMQSNFNLLNQIFKRLQIHYNSTSYDFSKFIHTESLSSYEIDDIHSISFCSRAYFFPTTFEDKLWNLKLAFVGLYPLLDLFISIGDGRETHFAEMLNKFHEWYSQLNIEELAIDRDDIESKLDFNPENLTDARKRNFTAIVQRQGQSKFRSELLKAYDGECAITDCDAEAALEAAHIVPYLGAETNCVANGLLLRADIHTLFDLYLISIDPDTCKIIISSGLIDTCYKDLKGKPLKSPQNPSAIPSSQALANHYKKFMASESCNRSVGNAYKSIIYSD